MVLAWCFHGFTKAIEVGIEVGLVGKSYEIYLLVIYLLARRARSGVFGVCIFPIYSLFNGAPFGATLSFPSI